MSFKQKFNIHTEMLDGRVEDSFDIVSTLGHGAMGPIYQARDRKMGPVSPEIVLKCREKAVVKLRDFQREAHYSYLLSPHESIINTYNVAYETPTEYVLVQEVAPYGTLVNWIPRRKGGLSEVEAKAITVKQLAPAIDFMHTKDVIHCDIRLENVLVFAPPGTDPNRSEARVKLAGFDKALRKGSLIKKLAKANPYSAPEICDKFYKEGYVVEASGDAWAFAVLTFYACSGTLPWSLAAEQDADFSEYERWTCRKRLHPPQRWKWMTPKLTKFFRKLLEIRREKRYPVREIIRYGTVKWKVEPTGPDGTTGVEAGTPIDPNNTNMEDDSSAEAAESLRAHIEDLEKCLEKRGVNVHALDEVDKRDRVLEWLNNVPSDASLPAMALDPDEEPRVESRVGDNYQPTSHKQNPSAYQPQRGKEERTVPAPSVTPYTKPKFETGNDNDSTSTTRARNGSVRRKPELDITEDSWSVGPALSALDLSTPKPEYFSTTRSTNSRQGLKPTPVELRSRRSFVEPKTQQPLPPKYKERKSNPQIRPKLGPKIKGPAAQKPAQKAVESDSEEYFDANHSEDVHQTPMAPPKKRK